MNQALDGELRPRGRRALDRHLVACPGCRAEMATTQRLFEALDLLDDEAEVPAPLAHDTLRTVRLDVAEAPVARGRSWGWGAVLTPALGAAAAVALMLSGIARQDESQQLALTAPARPVATAKVPAQSRIAGRARRTAPPLDAPPPALAAAPELFIQLPVLRNLEKLEHYDAIRTTTLDGDDSNG
jgi:anti-sigma factor RsiW